ncbi:MAG TPA: Hin recombinase, partial [Ruminococcus sp.]|nr:Hin recombinase [Ruminococcus sp.]
MNVDYKELCNELFGTTDVEKLKKIASKVNKKNNRGAGRKKAFTSKQINEMREMQA